MQEFYLDLNGFEFELSNYILNISYKDNCIDSVFVGNSAFTDEKHFKDYCTNTLYPKLKHKYVDKE